MTDHWKKRNVAAIFVTSNNSMIVVNMPMKVRRWFDADGTEHFVGRVTRAVEKSRPRSIGDLVGALIANPDNTPLNRGKIDWVVEYDRSQHSTTKDTSNDE